MNTRLQGRAGYGPVPYDSRCIKVFRDCSSSSPPAYFHNLLAIAE
jgi:hypothetical protein